MNKGKKKFKVVNYRIINVRVQCDSLCVKSAHTSAYLLPHVHTLPHCANPVLLSFDQVCGRSDTDKKIFGMNFSFNFICSLTFIHIHKIDITPASDKKPN